MNIWALKVGKGNAERVHESLLEGQGRFGWSYIEDADLHRLKDQIGEHGWDSLSQAEQDCYQDFLLGIEAGDYVVYVNVPSWGKCTLARVTGGYFWERGDDDFNHRFSVDPESAVAFDRNDAAVEAALSARLKLQGRWWRIYVEQEFRQLLERIEGGELGTRSTPQLKLRALAGKLAPALEGMTEQIQRTHPNHDLEKLVELALAANPDVTQVERRGGAGDHGADLVAVVETAHPITGRLQQVTYLIQVKSFVGTHRELQAAHDLRRAFEKYRDADEGVILSTAAGAAPEFEEELDRLRRESGKEVHLVIGHQVAAFLLRHGWDLLHEEILLNAGAGG